MTTDTAQKTRKRRLNPDIFIAAQEDDVDSLRLCLQAGENLNRRNSRVLGMTPMHLACVFGSNAFIAAAIAESDFDPWLRDANGRVAFDHAMAKNNRDAMRMLYPLMHPDAPKI